MSGTEVTKAAAESDPASAPGTVKFLGQERVYWRLLIRGAVLLMFTLGLYRFWLATDMRRFLWANTEIAGESLEYTGTATELLVGFLIAIALLAPVYALFSLAALNFALLRELSGIVGFLLLALLGQFAVYRARRYRLTRTVYRGVRFHQTGSAWRYAVCALFWWTMIVITAGLAYPWAQASLERFKMRNTYYGNLSGDFAGSGFSLFLRGFPMWLLVMVPFVVGMVATISAVDWTALVEAAGEGGRDLAARVEASNPGYATAIVLAILACGWAALAAAVLYPVFQALVLRWWMSGLRLGQVVASSRLRTGQVYRAYFRFLLYGAAFIIAVGVVGAIVVELVNVLVESPATAEVVVPAIFVVGYVAIALGYSTIYQATVKLSLWRLAVESLDLSGITALDHVKASGQPSSAVGEGLADALNVGGF
ncbi:MAG: hypothetical protein QOJ96_532 [Alphaproteobacteria bacterium]|jgi:uncharacterized membrane protein YjgN (DUF898 family)|nr:hypothetical protein [Alphaproteobacteria bacterium]